MPETAVPNGFATSCCPGGVGTGIPGPSTNAEGFPAPETALIVKRSGNDWVDAMGCSWNQAVALSLPDQDVFAVDANSFETGTVYTGVGTILFNMALNPLTGKLYVSNTESRNEGSLRGARRARWHDRSGASLGEPDLRAGYRKQRSRPAAPEPTHRLRPAPHGRERGPRRDRCPDPA